MTNVFLPGFGPERLGEILGNFRLRAARVDNATDTFGCLALLDQPDTDAVVVLNPNETNRMVLLDRKCDLFFLGIGHDMRVASQGILPAWKYRGNNHVLLNAPVVLIVRHIELAEKIQQHLNS